MDVREMITMEILKLNASLSYSISYDTVKWYKMRLKSKTENFETTNRKLKDIIPTTIIWTAFSTKELVAYERLVNVLPIELIQLMPIMAGAVSPADPPARVGLL